MNTPGAGPVTTIHLILLAIFAVLTVAMIARGVALRRRRAEAERVQDEAVEAIEHRSSVAEVQPAAPIIAPPPPEPAPASVAPVVEPVGEATPSLDEAPVHPTLADEPIAASAPFDAGPASVDPTPVAAAIPASAPGEWPVTTLKGLGPKVAIRLGELGVATVADMAALDGEAAQSIDAQLGAFTGRMGRDRWLEQARLLAAGDVKGFETAFGKL